MKSTRICPLCDSESLVDKTYNSSLNIDGVKVRVKGLEYSECLNCGGDPILTHQAKHNDRLYADARRAAKGLLTSLEVRKARERHGLTQQLCSRLFGGGENSFNKYESGTVVQSEPMDLLIRLMRDVPGVLSYVAKYKDIPEVAETVTVSAMSSTRAFYEVLQMPKLFNYTDEESDLEGRYSTYKTTQVSESGKVNQC